MEWLKSWWYGVRSGWNDIAPYSRRDVELHARLDGSLEHPLPQPEDKLAPWYLGAMKEHFDNIVRGIGGAYQEKDAPFLSQEAVLTKNLDAASQESDEAQAIYRKACDYFEQHNPDLVPDTQPKRTLVYWTVSFALFVLEFPMNFAAFQIFGDSANLLTGITTLMVAGILIGSAHFMGIEWRRGQFSNRQSVSVFVSTLTMPVLAILGVAALRALHFSQQTDQDVAKIPTNLLFTAFTVFNLGIYLIAALLSRWAHPVGAEQVIIARSSSRATRKNLVKIQVAWHSIRNTREVLHAKYTTEAHRVTDQHLELTKRYLMENVRVRKGQGVNGSALPPAFLNAVNVSPMVSLPWMFSRRPSERDQEEHPSLTDSSNIAVLNGVIEGDAAQ